MIRFEIEYSIKYSISFRSIIILFIKIIFVKRLIIIKNYIYNLINIIYKKYRYLIFDKII